MAIEESTREDLLGATKRFDEEFRDKPEWAGWEARGSQLYALDEGGQLYPPKFIVALATGQKVGDFYGGESAGAANDYLRARGFRIRTLRKRNPAWARDELILALDAYLTHRPSIPGQGSDTIQDLSAELNRIGRQLHGDQSETYRNPNGVYMKLMNYRALDPDQQSGAGLAHGGTLEKEVWEEYAADPSACAVAAHAIRSGLEELEGENKAGAYAPADDDEEAPEGKIVTRVHQHRERSRAIVERKKKSVLRQVGHLACEACGFNFSKAYGERGDGFIECHHEKPVSELKHGEKTKIKDLRLVCSNCHRMIHTRRPWLTVDQLRELPHLSRIQALFEA